jgi:glucose-6-phosphate-specific signal transduction histidine kinase
MGLFPARHIIDMKVLLGCALATSLLWATVTYLGDLAAVLEAGSKEKIRPIMMAGSFVGNYVAILTIVTWPLLVKLSFRGQNLRELALQLLPPRMGRDACLYAMPFLLAIAWTSAHVDTNMGAILRMSLFIPVAWMTLKYGWRGAALSAPVAAAAISLATESAPDPLIIQSQALVAFAVTCMFLMGARIASQHYAEEQERQALKEALRAARQSVQQGEYRLRQTSQILELVGGTVAIAQGRVLDQVRHLLPANEKVRLTTVTSAMQNRLSHLAESIHPVAWRERGLPAALRDTIGRVLDEDGIGYDFQHRGRGIAMLSSGVHHTIYRFACETVSQLCSQHMCKDIELTLRGGDTNHRRWVVIRIVGRNGYSNTDELAYGRQEHISVSAKLGATSADLVSLQNQAALYDGLVHKRIVRGSIVITALLHDPQPVIGDGRVPNFEPARRLWAR